MLKAVVAVAVVAVLVAATFALADPHERWEEHIAAFEQMDRETPPVAGGVLFAGSSSIVGWDTDRWFEHIDPPVVNRGFGGSDIDDAVHFAPRFLHPHRPDIVVLYAGDNDIFRGKSPERVLEDFDRFVETVREGSAEAHIIFISIKPSTSRWHLVEEIRAANRLVEERCDEDERLHYVDIFTPTLNAEGEPDETYLAADGLHISEAGYRKWTGLVRAVLDPLLGEE